MSEASTSLLHAAVFENNEKAVRFLLKHGADVNARARVVDNPVQKFADYHEEMCEIFSRYRRTSFSPSCTLAPIAMSPRSSCTSGKRNNNRQSSIVKSLHRQQQKRQQRQQKRRGQLKSLTPVHVAAANGRVDILELLISYGADVDAEMEGEYTPLAIAILYRHYEILKMLTKRGASVNARTRHGQTPMYFAVKTKQSTMVSFLLENGADPNVATSQGVTPLHIAVERKLPDVAEMLLKKGARVNVKTKTGVTPLHCAAVQGQTDVTELILKYGGDVSVIMNKGEIDVTPLLWVTESERRKIADVVKRYAPKTKEAGLYGIFLKRMWKQLELKRF